MSKEKIKTLNELTETRDNLKSQGKKVVTINGSFDILHVGHIKILQEAKKQGDILIVGLNSDASIKKYKSIHRPINNQNARSQFIAALACVDYVFIFDETKPMFFLEKLKPDIHANGSEYGKDCIEKDVVEKNGGQIHVVSLVDGYSTTKLIEKIQSVHDLESKEKKRM